MFLGLRSLIYPAPDLESAKVWYTQALGIEPYFDEPFYVGFDVGGYELGLYPEGDVAAGPKTYWGVADVEAALAHLVNAGATVVDAIADVGGGIRMAVVRDPVGNLFGIIENPEFEARAVESPGPGR
jgi:predicted enzyme related to lactoylglutathione lyase